ncbi:MAG: ANTAR domain-containing protein [Nevskia sp.]|nr:ANTAR domain-containing protein [Nevskia sp.]
MRIMLVDDDPARMQQVEQALGAAGYSVCVRLDTQAELLPAVRQHSPDVILIDVDAPGRDTLESLNRISSDCPRPVVMFAGDAGGDTIRRAVRAGVSAYVVDGLSPQRLKPILEVAIARFHEHQALKRELDEARGRLADRRDVDRAKGLLMQRRSLNEPQAYELLRKMAMDRGLKIGEAARALIAAAELL